MSSPYFKILSFVVVMLFATPVHACKCSWSGPFSKAILKDNLVVIGKVLSHSTESPVALSMIVEVDEKLSGSTQVKKGDQIQIFGDSGLYCRPYIKHFPINKVFILSLHHAGKGKNEDSSNYAISICGTHSLELKNGKVIGNIDNVLKEDLLQEMDLNDFKNKFRDWLNERHVS